MRNLIHNKKSGGAIQSIRSTIKTQDGTFSDTMDAPKSKQKNKIIIYFFSKVFLYN